MTWLGMTRRVVMISPQLKILPIEREINFFFIFREQKHYYTSIPCSRPSALMANFLKILACGCTIPGCNFIIFVNNSGFKLNYSLNDFQIFTVCAVWGMRPECCGQNANNWNFIIFNFVPEHKQHLETQIVTMKYYLIIKTSGPIQAHRLVPHCLFKPHCR